MKTAGKAKIAVLSYHIWRHPRSIKIARTLVRQGYAVKLWGARSIQRRVKLVSSMLEYLLAMLDVATLKADLYWVENIPDIVYLPLALLGRRFIYDRRSPWAKEAAASYRLPQPLLKFMEVIEMFMVKKSSYFTAVSTGLVKEFEHVARHAAVIPNYPERAFVRPVATDVRRELGVPPERKVLIYVGKLSRVEGTDLLPQIAEGIAGLNAELWIVGDGPARGIVKEMVTAHPSVVRWFGWVPYEEVPKYIAASDIGLVPRHKTGFKAYYSHEGIHKISEYFAYRKPVIASGIAPSPYYVVVDPGELGEVVAKAVRGEIRLPEPPKLYWEEHCASKVLNIIKELLNRGMWV